MKRKTEIYVKAVAFMQVAAVACTGLTETVSWQGGGKRLGNRGELEYGHDT